MTISLEVCANSATSALAGQTGGAARIELCENLHEGGTTPSYGQMRVARELVNIPLYILIRPRSGDFIYTDVEFEVMKADVQHAIEAGCNGIVMGILNSDSSVDIERCTILVQMAKQHGLGVTFHRAFDMCLDMHQAMEEVITMGCDHILTSGGKSTAIEGAFKLAALIQSAAGRIIIMPGGGITETNVADVVHFTGATQVHASARSRVKSEMTHQNEGIIMYSNNYNEYEHSATNPNRVKTIIKMANQPHQLDR